MATVPMLHTAPAVTEAELLPLQTVRDKCFDKCITNPGRSLSGSEQSCLQRCVDRYGEVRPLPLVHCRL